MSNISQPTASGEVLRRQRDGTRCQIPCPQPIIMYNEHMGGVDRGDQLRGYYCCRTKSRRFYKYIFYFLLDVAITNAFILYKNYSSNSAHKCLKDFRVQLATELIGDYSSWKRPGRQGSQLHSLPLRHFPVKLPTDLLHKRMRGRCTRCSRAHKRSDTQWYCQECGVWLCHTGVPSSDCFLQWHKNLS